MTYPYPEHVQHEIDSGVTTVDAVFYRFWMCETRSDDSSLNESPCHHEAKYGWLCGWRWKARVLTDDQMAIRLENTHRRRFHP